MKIFQFRCRVEVDGGDPAAAVSLVVSRWSKCLLEQLTGSRLSLRSAARILACASHCLFIFRIKGKSWTPMKLHWSALLSSGGCSVSTSRCGEKLTGSDSFPSAVWTCSALLIEPAAETDCVAVSITPPSLPDRPAQAPAAYLFVAGFSHLSRSRSSLQHASPSAWSEASLAHGGLMDFWWSEKQGNCFDWACSSGTTFYNPSRDEFTHFLHLLDFLFLDARMSKLKT